MSSTKMFRCLVVIGAVTYTAYWFMPYTYGYLDPDTGSLLAYSGFNAIVTLPPLISYALFAAWIIAAIGMFFFLQYALRLFVFLVCLSLALSPLFGVQVETAGGVTLLAITYMTDGALLALAYYSPVRNEFINLQPFAGGDAGTRGGL